MRIATEQEAVDVLWRVLMEEQISEEMDFTDWPRLNIRLTGEQFHGSLTPTVMRGFLEFQYSIYRAYAAAKFGIPDARRLSEEEKQELEIAITVEEGSSIFEVDIQALLEKLVENIGARMSPTELTVLAISLALIWSGTTILRKFLTDRKAVAIKKLESSEQERLVNALTDLSRDEKERLRIITSAMNENTRIHVASAIAQDGQADLLKGLSEADEVTIQGQKISGEAIRHMARSARRKAVEVDLEGLFLIKRVDTSDPLMAKVRVIEVGGDGIAIDANVQDDLLTLKKKKALQSAEWDRHPVRLSITAKMLDDEIRDAVITEVSELSESELSALTNTRSARSD